ncbi:MAG: glycosyltransferase [Betaproteobacteria bacterium]|nr:glycosyltransferase [Betaproteobacteria bacterium]
METEKLKVLTYRWHCAHQYELWKLGFQVELWHKPGVTMNWDYASRPMPGNAKLVTPEQAAATRYDLVILHFDENILVPHKARGALGLNWGAAFKELRRRPEPKVAICHGTPLTVGSFDIRHSGPVVVDERDRQDLVDLLGAIPVVCNSHAAMRQWGFRNGFVIWHGIDPNEFPYQAPKRPEVLITCSDMHARPWYQGYFFAREVARGLPVRLIGRDPERKFAPVTLPAGPDRFSQYVKAIGEYLIFMNPTLLSPMPRSRIEAAMTGACIVTTNHHDEDMWIKQGVNGYYTNDASEMREMITDLLEHPDKAMQIGRTGSNDFASLFHVNRYLDDWKELLHREVFN